MRTLEEIARDAFSVYSQRRSGRKVAWSRLSFDRQADWMDDLHLLLGELIDEVEKAVIAPQSKEVPQASYEAGILQGTQRERQRIKNVILNMKEEYLNDLKDFIKE